MRKNGQNCKNGLRGKKGPSAFSTVSFEKFAKFANTFAKNPLKLATWDNLGLFGQRCHSLGLVPRSWEFQFNLGTLGLFMRTLGLFLGTFFLKKLGNIL